MKAAPSSTTNRRRRQWSESDDDEQPQREMIQDSDVEARDVSGKPNRDPAADVEEED